MVRCRLCASTETVCFLDLGFTPPADGFLAAEQLTQPEVHYPLRVVRCARCGFVQLDHVVDPKVLYQNDYPYESSTTRTGRAHFDTFAENVITDFGLAPGRLAVDIGSNVGVLLGAFKARGMRVIGIDPAPNITAIAQANGIETITDFIGPDVAAQIVSRHGHAGVVTGTNVFAHVDDLGSFVESVLALLADDGVFIVEAPHLGTLLANLEYDTIYHEHLSYLSLTPLIPFLARFGLEVVDVRTSVIHGGSFRIFIARAGAFPVRDAVGAFLARERDGGIHDPARLDAFAESVARHRDDLRWLLHSLRREGKRIAAVSAPAKGMTLLNACGIGCDLLEFVTEKAALKIGRFTPGGHLPVRPDSAILDEDIDYALLLAWNFKDEIMRNLAAFRAKGGKFIIPIPTPTIVD